MSDDREPLYHCESCGTPLYEGDMAQFDSEGLALCEDHSATLSEIIATWEADIADEDEPCWPDMFDDIEEVERKIADMRADLAANGDRKLMQVI